MNRYCFNDLSVGMVESFTIKITDEMVDAFMRISGDESSLHADTGYAKENGHPDRVVHGMLTASMYSTLVGMHLPGENALLHGVNVTFTSPVYPGDALSVSGEISYLNDTFRQVEMKAVIVNQDGRTVSKAKIKTGVRS